MSEQNSGFATEGYEAVPNLYNDNKYLVERVSGLDDDVLDAKIIEYTSFLKSDALPHHRTQAERFLTHVMFEVQYRNGLFDEYIESVNVYNQ